MRRLKSRWVLLIFLLASLIGSVTRADLPKVPAGFEVRLVASVPAVEFPCQVATAPDGALFVAEDPMDQRGPYEAFDGRILLFRDGKDPVPFADGFRAIQGMAWYEGALYVCHMPFLTVVRDTDGDGKADSRKDLFKDLGPTNNQGLNDHIVSGIQFGMDGWLYISIGDKGVPGATRAEDGRKIQLKGGGVLRCRPDGTELEVYSSGTRNHLEANLDAADNLITYDNTDDGDGWWTRVTHHIYDGYYGYPYDYHDHADRFLPSMAEYGGGSPCGAVFYRDDVWPENYKGIGLWAEWGKGKVHAFRFEPEGASFKVAEEIDFAVPRGGDNFHPIDLAISHDGRTLYVADWNMGGWGSKTEKVGRVWAITYTVPGDIRLRGHDSDPIESQIKQLDHPAYHERIRAQCALIRNGVNAIAPVTRALESEATPALAKRHLIWVLDAVAGGSPEASMPLLDQLKTARVADLRAHAARALGQRRVPIALEPLVARLADGDPAVRLQAAIALNRIGDPAAVPTLLPLLADSDSFVAFAARRALRSIADWNALAAGLDASNPKVHVGIILACEGIYEPGAVSVLSKVVGSETIAPEQRARAIKALSQVHRRARPWDGSWWGTRPSQGKPPAKVEDWDETEHVLTSIRARLDDTSSLVRLGAVASIVETTDRASVNLLRQRFLVERDALVRIQLAKAFGLFEDKEAVPLLADVFKKPNEDERVRETALVAFERIGSDSAAPVLLALLDNAEVPIELQPRVIGALGRFRADAAAPRLLQCLDRPHESLRAAAAEALGRIGSREYVVESLRQHLEDASVEVRRAVILALSQLDDRDSVPKLITASEQGETRFEAMRALARLADARAVRVYLRGLADKNADLRRDSSAALSKVRDEAAPLMEQLAARRELPPSIVPELRRIYGLAETIRDWRILGPFARDAEPPFDLNAPVDLNAKYSGLGDAIVTWRTRRRFDRRGEVDLNRLFQGEQRTAFGYAEVLSPMPRKAELLVGSDDTLTVWLNGKQVFDFQGDRGYEPDQDRFEVELVEGTNRILVRCANSGGAWQYSMSIAAVPEFAFLNAPATDAFNPETYASFALEKPGNVERGRALFADLKGLACAKCHKVSGAGGDVGPDLSGIGTKYKRMELIESVLYPSSKIFSGYEPVVVATNDGQVLTGITKSEDAETLVLRDAEAREISVAKGQIDERRTSEVSLMPNGLVDGLSPQDFADLIDYLESLKEGGPSSTKP